MTYATTAYSQARYQTNGKLASSYRYLNQTRIISCWAATGRSHWHRQQPNCAERIVANRTAILRATIPRASSVCIHAYSHNWGRDIWLTRLLARAGADRYENRRFIESGKVRNTATPNRSFCTLYGMAAAFDRVDIGKLIGKLERLKVPAGLRRWIRNFLWKRTYRVRIDGSYSRTKTFCRGVPQGTILGTHCSS